MPGNVRQCFYSTSILSDSRYSIFSSLGELHIRNVSLEDGLKPFRCIAKNELTGETIVSSIAGR